jgi:hypothetical protein
MNKAAKVMDILKDGEWHTAPELRQKLQTSSINPVLKNLRGQGSVEMQESRQGNKVRAIKAGAD